MGKCEYFAAEVDTKTPVVESSAGKCYGVAERWFVTSLGPSSPSPGLVTCGAGDCMVVAVHDTQTDAGALAHISQTNKQATSLLLAKEIIMRMIVGLVGGAGESRVQIFLFQGNGLLSALYQSMSNGMLRGYHAGIVNHSNQGYEYMNYVYFPARRWIYPVTRKIGDLLAGPPPKKIGFDDVLNNMGKEFSVDTTAKVQAYADT